MDINSEKLRLIIGLKIKHYRQEKGYTLKHLAKKAGLSISYLNEIEKGKKYPKPQKIMHLAQGLGPEELGVFVRRLTVSGDHRVSIPIPPASEFTVRVYSGSDIVVLTADQESDDGIKGGVVVDV